jgi:hypothetical protein
MSCQVSDNCWSAVRDCYRCRFSGADFAVENCYQPINPTIKHPQLLKEKEERKTAEKKAKQEQKLNKNKDRSSLVKKANKAEVKAVKTLNSGRVNNDGDIKTDNLVIDYKLQTTKENITVYMDELDKVNNDCLRAGKKYGVLMIENKNGRKVVVMEEELFRQVFL